MKRATHPGQANRRSESDAAAFAHLWRMVEWTPRQPHCACRRRSIKYTEDPTLRGTEVLAHDVHPETCLAAGSGPNREFR